MPICSRIKAYTIFQYIVEVTETLSNATLLANQYLYDDFKSGGPASIIAQCPTTACATMARATTVTYHHYAPRTRQLEGVH
jgi:hypothetical protein